jgi:predicted permease
VTRVTFVTLATVIGQVLALVAVGVALRATRVLRPEDARPIHAVIIYAALPAMIFRAVHPAHLDWELASVAAVAWATFVAGIALAWAAARLLRLTPAATGGFMLVSALGNTGYIGYPVTSALLGRNALVTAVFSDVFGTVAALLTIGLVVAERYGESGGPVRRGRELLTFPAVLALAAALLLRPLAIPIPVMKWLEALASMVVPLIAIALGLSLRSASVRERLGPLCAVAAIKLVALPLVALTIGGLALRDPEAVRVATLQASMPSMMLTLVIGARFKLDRDMIAAAILVTTVGAILTVPLFQLLAG